MPDRYLGQLLGKYRTSRLLGTGSFSWVYEAADVETGAAVALKVLRPEYAGQQDAEARFRREAETARRLHHPNIVAVRDVGQAGGAPYVVMDLFPLTLSRRLELVHRLPERDVIRIGLDVASALTIAHAAGVVHRDIKPDNILLGDNGESVVGDFGLARALQAADPSMSASQQVMGTPHYFSPEQARGQLVDGRSDLYSLGIMLFRAATGHLPYEGDDWYAVARMHIEADVPSARAIVPELSEGFDAIVRRLLAKQPEERFANATRVIDALAQLSTAPERSERRAGSNSAETTLIAPAPMSAATFRRQRSAWMRRGGIAGVIAIAAIVFFIVDGSRSEVVPPPAPVDTNALNVPVFGSDTARIDSLMMPLPPSFETTPGRPGARSPSDSNGRSIAATDRRARVRIVSDSLAAIYVDNRPVVGAVTDVVPNRVVRIRAAFPNSPLECPTAIRDTMLTVRAGEERVVSLPVRACGRADIDVLPRTAVIFIQSDDDGSRILLRADTSSIVLPIGRYTYSASLDGYHDFNNGSLTVETAPTRTPRMRIRLVRK